MKLAEQLIEMEEAKVKKMNAKDVFNIVTDVLGEAMDDVEDIIRSKYNLGEGEDENEDVLQDYLDQMHDILKKKLK